MDINELQSENKFSIDITEEVSNLETSKISKELHPENI